MRNVEEHKKLLEQVKELELYSVDYFDVEKEFFLIDSDNLSDVQTRFYGYSIQESGIYEEDNLTEEAVAGLDGRGCYVYVEVKDGQITIKQDLNGCWGIYLFRHGDDFALSNSFFRLLDHVKFRYPLTVNRDYCNYLLVNDVCSHAYSETAVNEIQLVDRSAILHIDTVKQSLTTEFIDYKEYTVPLDSEEGIATLDRWVELWGNIFRGLAQHSDFITADLSGGFDTRVSLALLLNSGADLNKIRIFSIKDDLISHTEDYDIASQIANRFGFTLNKPFLARKNFNYSLEDAFNINLYATQTFNNIPRLWAQKPVEKTYNLTGNSGETLRAYWRGSPKEFISNQNWKTKPYSLTVAGELSQSMETVLKSAFRAIRNKYKIDDEDSPLIPQLLYQEARCRNHFGKESLCNYLVSTVLLSPALDPIVRNLQLDTPECPDTNLLMALLFIRYEQDLLKIPFDLNRSIAPETISYAQKINERFPRRLTTDKLDAKEFHLQPRDTRAEKILSEGRNNKNIPRSLAEACLKATFESSCTYGLFTKYFDAELYNHAASFYDNHVFGRDRYAYAVYGVTKVLEDVEISQRNHPLYRDMQRFLEQDFCLIPTEYKKDAQIIEKFSRYFTARVDIKLETTEGDFQVVSVLDEKANVSKPGWFQKDGIGYVVTSYSGKMEITVKATASGKVLLNLRGLDIRDKVSKHIPYWIDYTALTINGEKIFDTLTPVWHNKPYRHTIDAKADEEITIAVEWLPHRSDT